MATRSRLPPGKCQTALPQCPPGHEFSSCPDPDEYKCTQCGLESFQPNENRRGDKCRLRKICGKTFMEYDDYGSTVRDARCQCRPGYHFENEDQRACVPNRECGIGLGQGDFGVCETCIDKMMFSDIRNRVDKCRPLKNCAKNKRCTKRKSNGMYDNICGPVVRDVNDCNSVLPEGEVGTPTVKIAVIAGVVTGLLLLFLIIVVIFLCWRRQANRKSQREPLTEDQLEELKNHIVHKCEKDNSLCKKVLSESQTQIESRIERQYWSLAQALFRNHNVAGKYELIVDTYKDKPHREIVRGYLKEWKSWRGETYDAVKELFESLCCCKRDDIVYEICNKLRHDVNDISFDVESDSHVNNRVESNFCSDLVKMFPCSESEEETDIEKCEKPETTKNLLEGQSKADNYDGGGMCRARSYPSAPVIEEGKGLLTESEVHFQMQRQYSQPVQATS